MDRTVQIVIVIIIVLIMVVMLVGLIQSWGSGGKSFLDEFFGWLTGASRAPIPT